MRSFFSCIAGIWFIRRMRCLDVNSRCGHP